MWLKWQGLANMVDDPFLFGSCNNLISTSKHAELHGDDLSHNCFNPLPLLLLPGEKKAFWRGSWRELPVRLIGWDFWIRPLTRGLHDLRKRVFWIVTNKQTEKQTDNPTLWLNWPSAQCEKPLKKRTFWIFHISKTLHQIIYFPFMFHLIFNL